MSPGKSEELNGPPTPEKPETKGDSSKNDIVELLNSLKLPEGWESRTDIDSDPTAKQIYDNIIADSSKDDPLT